jgi:hypothetical protein
VATSGTSRKNVPTHGTGSATVRLSRTCPAPAGETATCIWAKPDFRPKWARQSCRSFAGRLRAKSLNESMFFSQVAWVNGSYSA